MGGETLPSFLPLGAGLWRLGESASEQRGHSFLSALRLQAGAWENNIPENYGIRQP